MAVVTFLATKQARAPLQQKDWVNLMTHWTPKWEERSSAYKIWLPEERGASILNVTILKRRGGGSQPGLECRGETGDGIGTLAETSTSG